MIASVPNLTHDPNNKYHLIFNENHLEIHLDTTQYIGTYYPEDVRYEQAFGLAVNIGNHGMDMSHHRLSQKIHYTT